MEGFPLGNGACGAMIWGDGSPLCFTLDHANLWDLRQNDDFLHHPEYTYAGLRRLVAEGRFEQAAEVLEARQRRDNPLTPTKISIGRAELALGEAEQYRCTLDLDRALVEGVVRVDGVDHALCAFIHHDRNVLCLRLEGAPAEATLRLVPLAEACAQFADLQHPPAELVREDDLCVLVQSIPEGPSYAVVWNPTGPDYYLTIEVANSPEDAWAQARATWQAAANEGFERLRDAHVSAWEDFWGASAVYLPESDLELLWYHGLYLLASSARRGNLPPGLQGLWAMDGVLPPWRGDCHADMNVQETFWPAAATGHTDLLDCWIDHMAACLSRAEEFTRRFFGTDGTFWPCAYLPHYTFNSCWSTVQFAWSNAGWLAWLVWLRWRHSLDRQWLAEVGYPLVSGVFTFYRENLEEEADGHLHIPLSSSPEYKENTAAAWARDPNGDIALIRRTCDWLIEMEQALELEELSPAARQVQAQLVPYALLKPDVPTATGFHAEKVLALWPGQPLTESHRHPSHLMAIHPAMDLTMEGSDEERQIISDSVLQFLELGQYRWAGHTYAQWVSFAACVGRAGMAYDALQEFARHWIGPNGLHVNSDLRLSGKSHFAHADPRSAPFTMEANCGITMGICDMLLQGWNDRVRVFPAVPEHWREVAFRDLVAEGAWKVSAVRLRGETTWVRIVATQERLLRLRNPFGDRPVTIAGADLWREGDDYVGKLSQGQQVVLAAEGEARSFEEAVERVRAGDAGLLGLR